MNVATYQQVAREVGGDIVQKGDDQLIVTPTGVSISRETLRRVVAENDKQRFTLDSAGTRIRARQGHSIDVDLGLEPVEPPERLYHGTARRNLDAICRQGLHRAGRHHVHLSRDEATARAVGQRHGPPVVLEIDARRMYEDGFVFFLTENGVWLTEAVPPDYLRPCR